jgi:hypothetical protein
MATLRGFFSLGQFLAPGISLIVSLTHVYWHIGWDIYFHIYTLPSLLTALLCFLYMILAWVVLKEPPKEKPYSRLSTSSPQLSVKEDDSPLNEESVSSYTQEKDPVQIPVPEPRLSYNCFIRYFRAFVMLSTLFSVIFLMGTIGSFNVPLTKRYFGWEAWQNSLMLMGNGATCILATVFVRLIAGRRFILWRNEKILILVFGVLTVGAATLFVDVNDNVHLWRYILGFILANFCFTVTATFLFGLYSKHNNSSQLLSWLPATAAIARILGPIYGGAATFEHNEANPNLGIAGAAGMALIFLCVFAIVAPFLPSVGPPPVSTEKQEPTETVEKLSVLETSIRDSDSDSEDKQQPPEGHKWKLHES